jgi:hypothetical protein
MNLKTSGYLMDWVILYSYAVQMIMLPVMPDNLVYSWFAMRIQVQSAAMKLQYTKKKKKFVFVSL